MQAGTLTCTMIDEAESKTAEKRQVLVDEQGQNSGMVAQAWEQPN